MIEIDLSNVKLFQNFIEIECDDCYVNLHNDFDCESIEYSNITGTLSLIFKPLIIVSNGIKEVEILFFNVDFAKMSMVKLKGELLPSTIDTIYRGRFEESKGILLEQSKSGKNYYYINFVEGFSFEIFSNKVMAKLKTAFLANSRDHNL
jgi:hypothetical protein